MGKSYVSKPPVKNRDREEPLNQPFKGALRGLRVGPSCLRCGETMDVRSGWSLSNPRGSRRAQRQGYLHTDCESLSYLTVAKMQSKVKLLRDGSEVPAPGVALEVPVYSDEELVSMLSGETA